MFGLKCAMCSWRMLFNVQRLRVFTVFLFPLLSLSSTPVLFFINCLLSLSLSRVQCTVLVAPTSRRQAIAPLQHEGNEDVDAKEKARRG